MAYGRLEVYWPDGRLESYLLEEDTVSVGRAEGNIIELETDSLSRYHFSLVRNGDTVTITDLESANGTFVDGMQLPANEPHLLGDVEEIMVGSLRIIFRQVDDSPTIMVSTLDDETQQMELGEAQIRVDIDYKQLQVWPAASSSAELSITNLGDKTRSFSIQVSGLPSGWLRITRPEVELDPNETAYILLNVKPPRRPNTVPQKYDVTIEVMPVSQPVLVVNTHMDVEIKPYSGFGMAVGKQLDVDDPIPIFLHNQGSSMMRFTLTANDRVNALTFQTPRTPLELKAGQRLRVDLNVSAKSPPLVGQSQTYPFIVQVQSHDASRFIAASDAEVTVSPRIPTWGAIAAAGITLSILIIGLLAVLGVLNPPEPDITSLTVSSDQVAQGEPLTVFIETENTDSYDVLVNQFSIQNDVSGDIDSWEIDTSELDGNIEIMVIARNGERSIRDSVSSYVYVPIAINTFEVSPNPLIANTVNTLTISWDVAGAALVQISGLNDFTNNLIQSSTEYGAVHTLEGIGGIPTESLNLTLYAEDQSGESIETSLFVPLVDPVCTTISEVALNEGPDTRYQQVGTIPNATSVVVLAQDADAAWLRVRLPEDIRGWSPREAFTCAENFDLADLRTEINVPDLPTPTSVPQATATQSIPPTPIPRNNTGD